MLHCSEGIEISALLEEWARQLDIVRSLAPGEVREVLLTGAGRVREDDRAFRFQIRFIDDTGVEAALALHQRVIQRMPERHLLYERDRSFFERCVGSDGCVVGAWVEDTLAGYAAAIFPAPNEEDYAADLSLAPEETPHITHLVGSVVHPTFRGNGLQTRLTTLRAAYAGARRRWHLCGDVDPGNAVSIENHLNVGFFLKAHRIDRLGLSNYVVHRDTRVTPHRAEDSEVVESSLRDIDGVRAHVDAGQWGYAMTWRDGEPFVRFARFVTPQTA